jgi:hypothetical protein
VADFLDSAVVPGVGIDHRLQDDGHQEAPIPYVRHKRPRSTPGTVPPKRARR